MILLLKHGLKSLRFVVVLLILIEKNEKLRTSAFSLDSSIDVASVVHRVDVGRQRRRCWSILSVANDGSVVSSTTSSSTMPFHTVQGILCREVRNELPVIGTIVVLEATAAAQEELVDECLELEEDKNDSDKQKRISEGDPYGCVCCKLPIRTLDYATINRHDPQRRPMFWMISYYLLFIFM